MSLPLYTEHALYKIKKISRNHFPIWIEYEDTKGIKRHITLIYVRNFPTYKNSPVKSQLKLFFDVWNEIINNIIKKGEWRKYNIRESNKLIAGKNSIWFEPLPKIFFSIKSNNYSINELLIKYIEKLKIKQKKGNINEKIIIETPYFNKLLDVYAHSDVNASNVINAKKLVPNYIDLSKLNIS